MHLPLNLIVGQWSTTTKLKTSSQISGLKCSFLLFSHFFFVVCISILIRIAINVFFITCFLQFATRLKLKTMKKNAIIEHDHGTSSMPYNSSNDDCEHLFSWSIQVRARNVLTNSSYCKSLADLFADNYCYYCNCTKRSNTSI